MLTGTMEIKLTDYQEQLLQALPPVRQGWNRKDLIDLLTSIAMYEEGLCKIESILATKKKEIQEFEQELSEGLQFQKERMRLKR